MPGFYPPYGKRIFDITLTVFLILILSWLLVLIGFTYLVTGNIPVLFTQTRIGKDGHAFRMWKFRTLTNDVSHPLQQRRFPLGNFLRTTNLDELPQLWNVLKGEMSLVGPRPLPLEYESLFTPEQQKRHTVLPGITGLAQVSGKNSLAWPEKFAHDITYVNKVSFRLDCLILFKTLTLALSLKRDVSLEEDKFTGK